MSGEIEATKVSAWKKALQKAGFPYVRKGTPSYDVVMKIYDDIMYEDSAGANRCWKEACQYITGGEQRFVTKEDPRYPQVKKLFDWMKTRIDEGLCYNDFTAYDGGQIASCATESDVEKVEKQDTAPTPPLRRLAFQRLECAGGKGLKRSKSVHSDF
jgi:hypothetical protein